MKITKEKAIRELLKYGISNPTTNELEQYMKNPPFNVNANKGFKTNFKSKSKFNGNIR